MTMQYYDYETKVQYSDLGEDGFLSQVGTLRLMQEAACEASASVDCAPGRLIERMGVGWILCGWKLKMGKKAAWGEPLTVRTWPRRMDIHFSDRDFLVTDAAGETVAAATSRWLLLDVRTGRVTRVTEELAAHYEIWDHKAVEGEIPTGGRSPEDARETFAYTALGRDLDTFHHVNNLHYLELGREALPEEVRPLPLSTVEILYKRQIKRGERVRFFYALVDGKHQVEIRDDEGKKTHALLWFCE